ncbi:hypothetical protein BJY04DRAFT_205208 [Aspergillus karnatakaensis]|uniref:uncharacterized protein n=1 Tax=Aspergillus karnatakaensis TaxID=1810916 RepID=UPI003CCDF40C
MSEKKSTHHEDATAGAALPATEVHTNVTWRDFWDNCKVLGYCFIIYLLSINFGYEISMMGKLFAVTPFARQFGQDVNGIYNVRATDQQLLNAGNTIGVFCSAFATGIISDLIGRKKTIIIACIICSGKLVSTLGFGLGHSLGPVFVAELAPTKMRGLCLVLINTMIVLGMWLNSLDIFACERYTSDLGWRIPIMTQIIPPGLLMFGLLLLPESPTWLLIKGRREDATRAFRRYNGEGFNVEAAMAVAETSIAKEEEAKKVQEGSSWLECFRGTNLRRTIIIVMVYISQQFIGVGFVSGYLTHYFRLAGVNDPLAIGQVANAVQLFGNICSWPLVDRVGRRPMIVGGSMIMTSLLLVIGGISTIGTRPALSATVAFMLRQKTYSINMMSSTSVSCLITQVMPYLLNSDQADLGGKICFVFFGASVLMAVYLYFCLPEWKGRNYAEVQEMFEKKIPARQFKGYVCEVTQTSEQGENKQSEA